MEPGGASVRFRTTNLEVGGGGLEGENVGTKICRGTGGKRGGTGGTTYLEDGESSGTLEHWREGVKNSAENRAPLTKAMQDGG